MKGLSERFDQLLFPSKQSNVSRKIATSIAVLQEKLDNIRGAVIMGECLNNKY